MHDQRSTEAKEQKIAWLTLVKAHGRNIVLGALVTSLVVALIGAAYVRWRQGTLMVATLEFRPTFAGVAELKYPNQLPFSSTDITATSVVDAVYDSNNISSICDRDTFRAGFYVEQRSDQSVFLDLEYQARLSEPRITMVERKALQEEHATKRKSLPVQYRLVYVTPPSCSAMPQVVLKKAMVDVLNTWATESETKRGVMNHQIEVLTPATLDVKFVGPGGLLLRADLLRTALRRIVNNIEDVSELPGAELIRLGPEKVTFLEVQGKIVDLMESRLDPLVMTSGPSMIKQSSLWVTETIQAAERRKIAAQSKAAAYKEALQDFSNAQGPTGPSRAASVAAGAGAPSNAQAMMAQVDRTFIDRIVEMSASSAEYRQKLTDEMVEAQLQAVEEEERASYYKRLQETSRQQSGSDADAEGLERSLNAIVTEGQALTRQFGALYEEFSKVALRSSGSMYVTEKPVWVETSQQMSTRSVLQFAALIFFVTVVLAFGFFVLRDRWNLVAH
jgi:hypothetical protein